MPSSRMNEDETRVIIGVFYAGHLGDALCATPLARLLWKARGRRIWVEQHPANLTAFQNNPYIEGFTSHTGRPLQRAMRGIGHMIQRLQQGFDLPIESDARPEIFLSAAERAWAEEQHARWNTGRRVCIVSPEAITDRERFGNVDWRYLRRILCRQFRVVYPRFGTAARANPEIPGDEEETILYEGLTSRQYISLFSVADAFCGGTSGGSHAAAAFGIPAVIVAWRELLEGLRFPCCKREPGPATFLYPEHQFLLNSTVRMGQFRESAVATAVADLHDAVESGRPNSHPANDLPSRCLNELVSIEAARRIAALRVSFMMAQALPKDDAVLILRGCGCRRRRILR